MKEKIILIEPRFPILVNNGEEITKEHFTKALGKAICGYWNGMTLQNILVTHGYAIWNKSQSGGITPTKEARKKFYSMMFKEGNA